MIHVICPYRTDRNLGRAYNEAMARIPDGDWAVICDWDVLFLLPETISHIQGYVDRFPDTAIFTCYASRSHVNSVAQMLPNGCSNNDSILYHTDIARKQTEKLYQVTNINRVISGYVMVISKATWKKYHFIDNGACLGVDTDLSKRLLREGKPIRRMDGVYVWHTYRLFSDIKDTSHLIPKVEDKTVYTVIFGAYERLKEPKFISKGWKHICYTDQDITSDVWEIRKIPPVSDARREARRYKALFYKFTETEFSIWIDASFVINTDLNIFWNRWFKKPFTAPKHPIRNCVYTEIKAAKDAGRGGTELIEEQGEHYALTIPKNSGVITAGILLRQRTTECITLCDDWWAETNRWSLRDQVSFCKASQPHSKIIHTFEWKYPHSREFIYIKHHDPYNQLVV